MEIARGYVIRYPPEQESRIGGKRVIHTEECASLLHKMYPGISILTNYLLIRNSILLSEPDIQFSIFL